MPEYSNDPKFDKLMAHYFATWDGEPMVQAALKLCCPLIFIAAGPPDSDTREAFLAVLANCDDDFQAANFPN